MWSEIVPNPAARSPPVSAAPPPTEVVRHLRQAGKGEIVVAIPRTWVRDRGLEIGGSLRIQEAGPGRLLLEDTRMEGAAWSTSVEGTTGEPLEHLFRRLIAGYLTGTPEITLTFPAATTQEVRRTVREFARRSGRMEVVAEGATSLTLRDISGGSPTEPGPLVIRMARAALEMQRRAGESLSRSAPSEEDAYWETRDDELDGLEWRVHRTLAAQAMRFPARAFSPEGASASLHLLAMARALERIGDHAARIGRASSSFPLPSPQPPLFRSVIEFHDQVLKLLERVLPLIERPEPRIANEVVDTAESLHASHMALLQGFVSRRSPAGQLPSLAAAWLTLVLDSVDRSAAYVADIAELALDRAAIGWVRASPSSPPREVRAPPGPRTTSLSSRKGGNRP